MSLDDRILKKSLMGVGGLKLIENDDEKKLRGIFPCVDLSFHMISEIFFGILPILRKIMK